MVKYVGRGTCKVSLINESKVESSVSGVKTSPVKMAKVKLFFAWSAVSFCNAGSRAPLRLPSTILRLDD